jgi:hypothetical protein
MPWDISNFTTSFSHSKALIHNEIVEKDQLKQSRLALDYTYTIPIKPIQPLKNLSKSPLAFMADRSQYKSVAE